MYKLANQLEAAPINKLKQKPQVFEFFQAVRLLAQYLYSNPSQWKSSKNFPVGFDFTHKDEIVRFKAIASLQFSASEIVSSHLALTSEYTINELQVSFLGLFGPAGILPSHYTELIIQRLQAKDTALRDFLDLFNHRMISLLYRSWEKHHFFADYERAQRENKKDNFSKIIASLIGNGTPHLQERTIIPDEAYLFYAGLFARAPRSASVLAAILADYFAVSVEIIQFQGRWLSIAKSDYTRLASLNTAPSNYNQLGCNTLLGQRTWDTQSYFTIKIGPLSYSEFQQFLPGSHKLTTVNALTRRYIGIHLHFNVQLVLKAQEVPNCSLAKQNNLGWSTWLKSKPILKDVSDTVIYNSI